MLTIIGRKKRSYCREPRVIPRFSPRTPSSVNASCTDRTSFQHITFIAFVYDLSIIRYFSHVRSVVIHTHTADQQYFTVVYGSRKWAVNCLKARKKYEINCGTKRAMTFQIGKREVIKFSSLSWQVGISEVQLPYLHSVVRLPCNE